MRRSRTAAIVQPVPYGLVANPKQSPEFPGRKLGPPHPCFELHATTFAYFPGCVKKNC